MLPTSHVAAPKTTCSTDTGPPVIDTLAAATLMGLAGFVLSDPTRCGPHNTNCLSSKFYFSAPILIIAATYGVSAGLGYRNVARCRQAVK
jgi:hypothetical protein